jgi:hypothetical protein
LIHRLTYPLLLLSAFVSWRRASAVGTPRSGARVSLHQPPPQN